MKGKPTAFKRKILNFLIAAFLVQMIVLYAVLAFDRYDKARQEQLAYDNLFVTNEANYVEKLLYLGIITTNDIVNNNSVTQYLDLKNISTREEDLYFYNIFRTSYISTYGAEISKVCEYVDSPLTKKLVKIELFSPNPSLTYTDFLKPFEELDEASRRCCAEKKSFAILAGENVALIRTMFFESNENPAVVKITFDKSVFSRSYDEAITGNLTLELAGKTYPLNEQRDLRGRSFKSEAVISIADYSFIHGGLTYEFPGEQITAYIGPEILKMTLIFLGITAAAILIIFVTTKYLTNSLYYIIESIQQDGSPTPNSAKSNEFDLIRNKLMELSEEIKQKENRIHQNEIAQKNAETRLLLELFKPHFLYNTLACLKYMLAGNPQLVDIVGEMVNYYRAALNKGSMVIPIQNEIAMVESYIKIQNFCYEKTVVLETEVEPPLGERRIHKLLIQPLVENAFIHGFAEKETGCRITIRVTRVGDRLFLSIEDNGCGMEREKIEEILGFDKKEDVFGLNHYGVYNTIMRLKSYYGDRYRFRMDSRIGEGTRVDIEIPVIPEHM